MNQLFIKLSCALALSAVVSGCAFSTDKIALAYTVRGARDKVAGADGVKVQVTVNDQRAVRDKVGKKINGFGKEMGAIVSTTDVAEVVRGAIETELNLRGFSKGDAALVSCDLIEFWNHFKIGFWAGDSMADLNMIVHVKNHEGAVVFSRNVVSKGLEPNIQVPGGHNAKLSLEQALGKAIEDLFQDPAFLASLFKAAGVPQ